MLVTKEASRVNLSTRLLTVQLCQKSQSKKYRISRLNAGGVSLKLGLVDPAFIWSPAFIY